VLLIAWWGATASNVVDRPREDYHSHVKTTTHLLLRLLDPVIPPHTPPISANEEKNEHSALVVTVLRHTSGRTEKHIGGTSGGGVFQVFPDEHGSPMQMLPTISAMPF